MEDYVMMKYINPILKIDSKGNNYVCEEDLNNYKLGYNEMLYINKLLDTKKIEIKKRKLVVEEQGITEKDRTVRATDYNYGEIQGAEISHLEKQEERGRFVGK